MPYCAVLECKNESRKANLSKGGITYHRFPKDANFKEKWIEATGRQNWFPVKTSTICSIHFLEKDFLIKSSGNRYITTGAIPVQNVFQYQSAVQKPAGPSSDINLAKSERKRKFDAYAKSTPETKVTESPSTAASTPRKKRLHRVVRFKEITIKKQNLRIRRLQAQNRRLKQKVNKIENVLKVLQEKFSMDNENLTNLKNTNVKVNEIVNRQIQNLNSKTSSTKTYSAELRSFALTLHYYSPKAYQYVRSTFNNCLPHPQTLKKWYAKVNGEPGFTKESLEALKLKADSSSHPLLATLVIDEMAIRKRIEWDGHKEYGYVNMGTGLEGDHLPEAREALVFLITALNANFKIPVAFFLVDGVSGAQRAELVKQCIERVHGTGVKIVALTFDGCAANISMAQNLGCSFQNGNIQFEHPVTKSPIVLVLDPCHMIKLIRNALQAYKVLYDEGDNEINWQYLVELNSIQEKEKMHLSNKLRFGHINFQNQRMKVKLATQLFSQSVAEAIQFCRKTLEIEVFKDSAATEKIILILNNMFDIFNSRNLHQYGFKKALNQKNASQIFDFLAYACNYIANLKMENGTYLKNSSRKTGFLGFLGCAEALKSLYASLVKENVILYLPFYKMSQDHLELMFGNIRAHGGSNNNPTARQFVAAYKKLLVHVELKDFNKGNCTSLEEISILNCSSAVERINKTTIANAIEYENLNQVEDKGDDSEIGEFLQNLSEFSLQSLTYIAGYIVRMLIKKIHCDDCVNALISKNKSCLHNFIIAKDKGGLLYPSSDVIHICKVTEKVLRYFDDEGKILKKEIIMAQILRNFVGINLFHELAYHEIGQFPASNHATDLIKAIAERYINIRSHHLLKTKIKLTKRQLLNKYVLFQGQ